MSTSFTMVDVGFGARVPVEFAADSVLGAFATTRLPISGPAGTFSTTKLAISARWDAIGEDVTGLIPDGARFRAIEWLSLAMARVS